MLDKTLSVSLKIALEKAGDPMLVVLRSDDARTTRGPWTHLHSTELNISTCAFDKLFMLFLLTATQPFNAYQIYFLLTIFLFSL